MNIDALAAHLEPIRCYLEDNSVSEVLINTPKQVFVERNGKFEQHANEKLDLLHLNRLGVLIANFNKKPFGDKNTRLAGILPQGCRIQIIREPVLEAGKIAFSIRKQVIANYCLDDFEECFFQNTQLTYIPRFVPNSRDHLRKYKLDNRRAKQFLRDSILKRKTIVISGGTSTGKTTFLNACLKEIPNNERLIILEDTREIFVSQPNHLCLLSGTQGDGAQEQDMIENLKASLRLRPDRILLGELRGGEAATFLEAASTGHEGSFTTIHASSAMLALERLCMLAERGGLRQQSREELREYVGTIIDIIIQLKRCPDGKRHVSEILSLSE